MKNTDKYLFLFGGLAILGFLLGIVAGLVHIQQGASQFRNAVLFLGATLALFPLGFLAFATDGKGSRGKS